MAQEPLVESDIRAGREFIRALEGKGVPVEGAFWLFMPDIDRWKLFIVSERARAGAHALYTTALDQIQRLDLSKVQFVAPEAPVYRALRNVQMHGGDQMRVSQSMFNGFYVDEALVYQVAA